MTQRATGNGYSWWWASHIRTKQSKWLEQNLQDMEDKVEHVLNLIQKDGDSFAKRAEMYYKHRPELISFVEETVRAYRSLAERYDKLSTDLQKANTTIAAICPEKVTYDDDDDYTIGPSKSHKTVRQNTTKIPKAPKLPSKGALNKASKTTKTTPSTDVSKSDLTKDDQEDFETSMVESMLKSCEETLQMLQEKQEKLSHDARLEQQRFDEAKEKLESLKHKFNLNQNEEEKDSVDSNQDAQKDSKNPQTVAELGETIDMLVNKMISLETSVSSQTSIADMLRKENDDLQKQIQNLESEKAALMNLQKTDNLESTENTMSEEEKRNQGTISFMKSAIDFLDEAQIASASEEKLRMDIDAILSKNLDFWLRFSTALSQVQKFRTQVNKLQEEVKKMKTKGLAGKSSTSLFTTDLISDIKPKYKHLKEINTKLAAWLHQSKSLKDELKMINLSLSKIQEDITQALREGVKEEEIKFSTHHAAKFKGEIMNMKRENNKVNEELEAGLVHAIALKLDIEKTLERLEMEFGLSTNQNQPRKGKSSVQSVVTLRSLLYGRKSNKQKPSLFACIGHHKKFSAYNL